MNAPSAAVQTRPGLGRGARGVLLFAVGLVALSVAQLASRFALPTDGWAVLTTDTFGATDWTYWENLVGAPSELRRGDLLIAVDGRSVRGVAGAGYLSPPPGWGAEQIVALRIARQGQELTVPVPVVHWTCAALWRHLLIRPDLLVGLLGGLACFALALFTVRQRPEVPAARALLVLSAAFLASDVSVLLPDGLSVQFDQPAVYTTAFFSYLIFGVLLAPALLAFTLLFPRPKRLIQRHPRLGLVPFGVGLLVGALVLGGRVALVGWLATWFMVLGSLVSLVHAGMTQRDAVSRAQMRWAGGGFAVGTALMLLVLPSAAGWVAAPLLAQLMASGFAVGFTVIGVALAMAILRYHLFDVDVVINRALVYLALTVCVITMYVLVVGYLGMLFRSEGNPALSLVAAGAVAVSFAPLRDLVQRGVNRLMYGQRDEPYRVLTRLGRQLEAALEPSSALSLTAESVARALKLPYAAVALHHDGGAETVETVASYGQERDGVDRFPLIYGGQTLGALVAAPRAPNEPFSPADRRLLQDLARQTGVAAHAVLLAADLERARLRLVTERGEARRQLGSDLHDGVGHQLVGLARQVERAMAAGESEAARGLLAEVDRQLVALTKQVRGLAHRLFPPELALLGLAGALRERAQDHPGVRIHVAAPEDLPPLPAEVESAAYLIALEALTNVEKHAGARVCHIRLGLTPSASALQPAVLALDLRDDGRGLPPQAASGLGLLSMQARAAEVGGTCRIESNPGGGTAVIVRIPCPTMLE